MTKNQALRKSILNHVCPQCLNSKMYIEKNPYKISTMTKMHERCPSCNVNFFPEPGFYFGAMYVTYGLVAAEFIAFFVFKHLFNIELSTLQFGMYALILMLVLSPLNFRFSRLIWINLFVKYDEKISNSTKK